MLHSNFVYLGVFIGTSGAIIYLLETIRGRVKPNRVSFLLWSVAPMIAFAAQIRQGSGLEALMTFSTGFLPLLTFIASFINKNAVWKLTLFDFGCGVLSVIGLFLWIITENNHVAIFFSILADGLAGLPTAKKAYKYPETEIAWPWLATCIGVVITLLTLPKLTFANSGFIIYIFILNMIVFYFVQFKVGIRENKSS